MYKRQALTSNGVLSGTSAKTGIVNDNTRMTASTDEIILDIKNTPINKNYVILYLLEYLFFMRQYIYRLTSAQIFPSISAASE